MGMFGYFVYLHCYMYVVFELTSTKLRNELRDL